ncbi:GTPase Era involved in 16S rRNA processing [Nocardioides salarius]|uniref:GTPase Era involved in 16S rRNA processing n=1 Tax=Nocardioides salarius TaxID=374513 RepID=A0ABS2M7B5_9ACTN|nr:GTPase [Nocardioides salarius]MBM7507075.1 GTPase Era involved in 16S rRNA processing [Nocardioides salarius]
MTSLLEGAKKLVTRGTDTGARIEGLATAAEAARGRLDDALVGDAEKVVDRATSRLRLSAGHTVVAIAGATGSGKSSTFNALTGLELSAVGVRRPTTSWATACVWGSDGAGELLDWLGIPPRHQTTRDSMLDTRRESQALEGVVLLDLPDHDSTEVSHHLEVDRLVALADMLVWVLDPQKYADAAIHDRYLAPLKTHEGVMVVVLNHIDTVPADGREAMLADVRRLLEADGLGRVPVIGVSARQGIGLDELRGEIESRVRAKKMTAERIESDVRAAAARLQEAGGDAPTRALSDQRVRALQDAFAEAAGVPTVVEAVERSTRLRAGRATGWPLVSWVGRLRPDPLKRLQLDLGGSAKALRGAESAVPGTTSVQRARVDSEVRALADDTTQGLGRPWADAVRRASVQRLPEIGDRLDDALRGVDLQASRIPVWAGVVRVLQWVLVVAALLGAAWTVATALSGTLDDTPVYAGVALPLILLLGGVGLGVLLALVCRGLVAGTARRRASVADTRLREAVGAVAHELVVSPVEAELEAYTRARGGLSKALATR